MPFPTFAKVLVVLIFVFITAFLLIILSYSPKQIDTNQPCNTFTMDQFTQGFNRKVVMSMQMNILQDPEGDVFTHFLQHYFDRLGLSPENFCYIMHFYDDKEHEITKPLQNLIDKYNIQIFRTLHGPFNDTIKRDTNTECLKSKDLKPDDWILETDSDELQIYGDHSLSEILCESEKKNTSAVFGRFKDRVTWDGSLVAVKESPDIWRQFPLSCEVTKVVAKAETSKAMLHKARLRPRGGGHHYLASKPRKFGDVGSYPQEFAVHHFKWIDTIKSELERRIVTNYTYKAEAERVLQHLKQHHGKLCTQCDPLHCKINFPFV